MEINSWGCRLNISLFYCNFISHSWKWMLSLKGNRQGSHCRFAHQEKKRRKKEVLLGAQIYFTLGDPLSRDDECNFFLQWLMTSEGNSHRRGDPTLGNISCLVLFAFSWGKCNIFWRLRDLFVLSWVSRLAETWRIVLLSLLKQDQEFPSINIYQLSPNTK